MLDKGNKNASADELVHKDNQVVNEKHHFMILDLSNEFPQISRTGLFPIVTEIWVTAGSLHSEYQNN